MASIKCALESLQAWPLNHKQCAWLLSLNRAHNTETYPPLFSSARFFADCHHVHHYVNYGNCSQEGLASVRVMGYQGKGSRLMILIFRSQTFRHYFRRDLQCVDNSSGSLCRLTNATVCNSQPLFGRFRNPRIRKVLH